MFRRTLVGAALVVLLAAPVRAAEVDPILPAETEWVASVNVRQILGSELFKNHALGQIKEALAGSGGVRMMRQVGIEPLTDIDRVTVGYLGEGPGDVNAVFVVRGKFDPAKLLKAAQSSARIWGEGKVAVVEEGRYRLVRFSRDDSPRLIFMAVADEKTIVGGTDKELVTDALGAAEKGGRPRLKKELAALVLKQDEKASVWAAGLTEGRTEWLNRNGTVNDVLRWVRPTSVDAAKLQKQLEKLQAVAVTLRLTSSFSLELVAGMEDADAAGDFGATVDKMLKVFKLFLPLAVGNTPQTKPLIDEIGKTLNSRVKDKDVLVSLTLSAEAIGKATGGGDN